MFHNVHHEKMPKNLNYVFRESIGVYEGIYSAIQPETENIIVGGGNIFQPDSEPYYKYENTKGLISDLKVFLATDFIEDQNKYTETWSSLEPLPEIKVLEEDYELHYM